jgi:hypothetical protein
MEFQANHFFKGHLSCQQYRSAHSCTDVEKDRLFDAGCGSQSSPTLQKRGKHRRRNSKVSRRVTIMLMAALQVPAGDKAAGANAEFFIEWMDGIPVRDRKARKLPGPLASACRALFSFHVSNLAQL